MNVPSSLRQMLGFGRVRQETSANPALEFLKTQPLTYEWLKLLSAFPVFSLILRTEAANFAKLMKLRNLKFEKCVLDLELLGSFEKLMNLTKNRELSSAYVDALLIDGTGELPSSTPTREDYLINGTTDFRGIAKYVSAPRYFDMPRPHAWLFGKEFSMLKTGGPADIAYVAAVGSMVVEILKTGKLPFELISEFAWLKSRVGESRRSLSFNEAVELLGPEKADEFAKRWLASHE